MSGEQRSSRVLASLVSACAVALFTSSASAQVVGRCVDQVRGQAFAFLPNAMMYQEGNPANASQAMRDPSGQTFLRLPSAAPQFNAFFVSWTGQLLQIDRVNGARVIGGCQFHPGVVPPNPTLGIYRPPVMLENWGVQTPAGFMPIPKAIADQNRPYAPPMITGQADAERCYQQARDPADGELDRERFGDCMVESMIGERELATYRCMRNEQSAEARAFCMVGVLGGKRERQIAEALRRCHGEYGKDWSRYPLCMSSVAVGGDAGRLLACVEQQSRGGDVTVMGTAMCYGAQHLDLNPEMQIVVQCAATTGGQPYAFAGCAGGQLTLRELDKCLSSGVGGPQGCFGPNNDIVRGLREAGQVLAEQFGPTNDLTRLWNNAVRDITVGPGKGNDAVRVFKNVGNEVGRTANRVGKAIERAVPRIRVRI